MNAICPEAIGSGGFVFLCWPGSVSKRKERIGVAWNSMSMCGGSWMDRLLWLIYTPVFAVSLL